jgi:lysophospholipase L1-like esterase
MYIWKFQNDPGTHHGNFFHRNKTVAWSGTDKEDLFQKNCSVPETFQQLTELGWTDPNIISYKYNNYGFRTPEFDDRPSALALGCSFTEGVGLGIDQVWPSVLSKLCNLHFWNLGVGGSAFDTVFRLLDYYLLKLNVKFVCILAPPSVRFEYCDVNGNFISISPANSHLQPEYSKIWLTQDINSDINAKKNKLAIQQCCANANIPLFFIDLLSDQYCDGLARDLMHPGVQANQLLAKNLYNQIVSANINLQYN